MGTSAVVLRVETGDLRSSILQQHDSDTQQKNGAEIDLLLNQLGSAQFDKLAEEYEEDKEIKHRFEKVKLGFTITSVVLAIISVIAAIASIIFSSGLVVVGTVTLAFVTGFVTISASFGNLDGAISRYMKYISGVKEENTRLQCLEKRVGRVKAMIAERIANLSPLGFDAELVHSRVAEILAQIRRYNAVIDAIKGRLPAKTASFERFVSAPLLASLG